ETAMEVLHRLGLPAAEPVLHGTARLDSEEQGLGLMVLADLGAAVVPLLLKTIADSAAKEAVREIALRVFCEEEFVEGLGAKGRKAVPVLADALADGSPAIRSWAAEALEQFGPAAASAQAALRRALDDPEEYVRLVASRALAAGGRDSAVRKRLADPDPQKRI